MFEKILIANRGEIAVRVHRAAKALGIKTVAIYSDVDKDSMHVQLADEAVCIGDKNLYNSYLNIQSIIAAAELTNADAIHPGYGFLSENDDFAKKVTSSGFVFIGPSHNVIADMGNKIRAKEIAKLYNLNLLSSESSTLSIDANITYPIILKAKSGGGGRGMRIVKSQDEFANALMLTKIEAENAFGDNSEDSIYVERFLSHPRHIEIQILADRYGNVVCMGDRDCSIQRRYQKIIEEAPALEISYTKKTELFELCRTLCKKIGYIGAGTMEFLYQDEEFFFIEMNTRIQVEHTVTEMITGIDLIRQQIYIAAGEKLAFNQDMINAKLQSSDRGHAIEARINAEDPSNNFNPSPGHISFCYFPSGFGVRVDSAIYSGYNMLPYYDSMLAKIIVHDVDRQFAIRKMINALKETQIIGIKTNLQFLLNIFTDELFINSMQNTSYLTEQTTIFKYYDQKEC